MQQLDSIVTLQALPMYKRSPRFVFFALATLGAVSSTGCFFDSSTLNVGLTSLEPAEVASATIEVLVDGQRHAVFAGPDLGPYSDSSFPQTSPRDIPSTGQASVRITYIAGGGDSIEAVADWELRSDFEWSLLVWPAATDPIDRCFGCQSSWRARNLSVPDSLPSVWLVLGGIERGSDVVF